MLFLAINSLHCLQILRNNKNIILINQKIEEKYSLFDEWVCVCVCVCKYEKQIQRPFWYYTFGPKSYSYPDTHTHTNLISKQCSRKSFSAHFSIIFSLYEKFIRNQTKRVNRWITSLCVCLILVFLWSLIVIDLLYHYYYWEIGENERKKWNEIRAFCFHFFLIFVHT